MAGRVLASRSLLVVYYRNRNSGQILRRCFSSQNRSDDPKGVTTIAESAAEVTGNASTAEPMSSWLDIKAGIFGPMDVRLPLPGSVGPRLELPLGQDISAGFPRPAVDGVYMMQVHQQKDKLVLNQLGNPAKAAVTQLGEAAEAVLANAATAKEAEEFLEYKAQPCPKLLKKDIQDLFPDLELSKESLLTAVTLARKSSNDMSCWSEDVEVEREELVQQFIAVATMVCNTLQAEGYWADFIDPTCGRPHYGVYTNATLFETDYRYRYLGFRIDDLGCCKVITHRLWGTNVFVGVLFTNAPTHSEVLEECLKKYDSSTTTHQEA